jgi:hypothetical protein
MENDLKGLVGAQEKILYEGKPDKKCFIFESIFNPMMPFAIIWAIIDFGILGGALFSASREGLMYFIIPFMLIHLMPVWIYLGGILKAIFKLSNSVYIISDKAIYISKKALPKNARNRLPYCDLSSAKINRGIFDNILHKGDIILNERSTHHSEARIENVTNYEEIEQYINARIREDRGKTDPHDNEVVFSIEYK